jgi:hypothetical protein
MITPKRTQTPGTRTTQHPTSPVARLASDVLIHNPRLWSLVDIAPLKAAEEPELRRRAWWIHRHLGGWETVIADLELLHDTDPQLAASGRRPVPPMYFQPADTQRQHIAELLATASLDRDQLLAITTAAGLPDPVRDHAPTPDSEPVPAASRRRWWRIGNRPPSS